MQCFVFRVFENIFLKKNYTIKAMWNLIACGFFKIRAKFQLWRLKINCGNSNALIFPTREYLFAQIVHEIMPELNNKIDSAIITQMLS